MAWIESHQTLKDHPKTRRLARYLKISVPAAIGHLHCLWWWALDYAQDGDLSKYEPADIADAAMWEGDAEEFVAALVKAGFLDQDNEDLRIHDWDEYTGRLIAEIETKKKRKCEWMRKYRAEKRARVESTSVECGNHVDSTQDLRGGHVDAIPNLTIPNHNQTKPNQDKDSNNGGFLTESTAHCARADSDRPPTNKDLIAELTAKYRAIEGVKPAKGDYAFIGALYNRHGYDQVLDAISRLQMVMATQELQQPLIYLKAMLERHSGPGPPAPASKSEKKQGRSVDGRARANKQDTIPEWERRFYGEDD